MRRLLRFLPRAVRDPLIRRRFQIDDDTLSTLVVKVADTVDEHEQSGRLLHGGYVQRGLMPACGSGLRVTPHGLLPTTTVFVAKEGATVVGTMSLAIDSELGLAMDKTFGPELAPLRADGRRIAEVGALAVAAGRRRTGVAMLLNKLMWQCASQLLGVHSLVISVSPDAACVYQALLRFRRIGPVKTYPGLKTRAVLLELDLVTAEGEFARAFSHLGTDSTSPYYQYCVAVHPQLQLPTAEAIATTLAAVRVRSAERLSALEPDCFRSLDDGQRRVLRTILPSLRQRLGTEPFGVTS